MNDKRDLTRIEDLSEFLHQNDPDVESKLTSTSENITENIPEDDVEEDEKIAIVEEEAPPHFDQLQAEHSDTKSPEDEEAIPSEITPPPPLEVESPNENILELPAESPPPSIEVKSELTLKLPLEEEKNDTLQNNVALKGTSENIFQDSLTVPDFNSELSQSFTEEPHGESRNIFTQSPEISSPIAPRETRETYSDVRKFASNIVPGLGTGGGPPYSILLKNIRYLEDTEDILRILTDLGAISAENKIESENALKTGNLLLSQLSEFAAIVIAHKIRRFDLDLEIGPSEQIHPSKFYNEEGHGPITKNNFLINREDHHEFIKTDLTPSDILLTTQPILQNYQIIRYMGIVSEHLLVNSDVLHRNPPLSDEGQIPDPQTDFAPMTEDLYKELQNAIKNKALKMEGNAVIGVSFQITPMNKEPESSELLYYQISCTGNVVLAARISQDQL